MSKLFKRAVHYVATLPKSFTLTRFNYKLPFIADVVVVYIVCIVEKRVFNMCRTQASANAHIQLKTYVKEVGSYYHNKFLQDAGAMSDRLNGLAFATLCSNIKNVLKTVERILMQMYKQNGRNGPYKERNKLVGGTKLKKTTVNVQTVKQRFKFIWTII